MANPYDSIPTRVNNTVIDASWFNTIKTTLVNNGSVKHNKSATTAPTTSNDETENYEPGSTWADITNDKFYYCIDASTGSAVWFEFANTSGTQTLTNKRLDSPKINEDVAMTSTATELNQLDGVSVGGNSSGDIITTDDTQTLTNKTLTTPQVNEAVNLTSTSTELNQLDGVSVGGNSSGDILTTDDSQSITNKDIDGGTASNTLRVTIPKNTTSNLNALTRKEGTIVYDTTVSKLKYDDGIILYELAEGTTSTNELVKRSKNFVINPRFDWWRINTTQASDGYGSDDMGYNGISGYTRTHSRQAFTIGQTDVPGNPIYYSRTVCTASAGVGDLCSKQIRFEDVRRFSGKAMTFIIYAREASGLDFSIETAQHFGTGGSPSSSVRGITVDKFTLSSSWDKYIVNVTFPSISGKTIGTNNNSYSEVLIYFGAGSNYNALTDSLGHQSGTFDLSYRFMIEGTYTSITDIPQTYDPTADYLACLRHYQKSYNDNIFAGASGSTTGWTRFSSGTTTTNSIFNTTFLKVPIYNSPSASLTTYDLLGNSGKVTHFSTHNISPNITALGRGSFEVYSDATTSKTNGDMSYHWVVSSQI